jgi:hypothetical protein
VRSRTSSLVRMLVTWFLTVPSARLRRSAKTGRTDASQLSANNEVELDPDEHVDRRGPQTSRLEPPLGNSRHGLFIEAPPRPANGRYGFATRIRRL